MQVYRQYTLEYKLGVKVMLTKVLAKNRFRDCFYAKDATKTTDLASLYHATGVPKSAA